MSKASPALFLACATGTHVKDAVLTVRRGGATKQDYLVLRFDDVLVTSYHVGGAEEDAGPPTDQVSFTFGRIRVEYRPQKADGSLAAAVKAGWDVKQGKAV